MLSGKYKHTIDAKGRVIVPIRFREDLGDTFIVTRGLDECLAAQGRYSGICSPTRSPSNWTGRGGLYSRRICVNSRD